MIRPFWVQAVLACVLACVFLPAVSSQDRPNILFIMIDDLGWMDIRPQGNEKFVTPNLDRLAKESTRFTDFYAAAPVCSPTRAACITGLAPARVKVTNHIPDRWSFYNAPAPAGSRPDRPLGRKWGPGRSKHVLDKKHRTIAQRLKKAGYKTGFIGKWHLAGPDWKTTDTSLFPESYGFDVNVAGNAMGGPGTFYAPIKMPNYKKGKAGEYLPDLLAQEAVDYIESAKDDSKPFFLCLWTYTVHYPIQATPELYSHYTDERNKDGSVKEPNMKLRYRAMVEGMDIAVGRVLRALDDAKLASNTLVVFTSDNGQMPGASVADPLRAAKGYLYEGGIRVPMMIRWPGHIRAGAVDATPAISMDFAPTFLDAAGVDYSADEFDGESLLPVASGKGALKRDAIYLHYPHYCYHGKNDMGSIVRSGKYKYIHHYDNEDHELFDLESDIGEKVNLIDSARDKAAELKAKLFEWLKATGAELPRLYKDIPAKELPGRKRAAPSGKQRRKQVERPNVVIILADDLGCGDMSLYDGWVETPRIDRLAAQGVKFTDFHSNSSVCSPTRIAFLTGRYQQRVGIVDVIVGRRDKDGLEPGQVTISSLMKRAGYRTAVFGKWHCGTDLRHNPTNHGFDEFKGFLIGGSDYHRHRNWMDGKKTRNQDGYSTHLITDYSVDFIRRNKDKPFFLYVSHAAVHNPYQTPADTPESRPKVRQRGRKITRPKYKVMLEELDKGVGKILDTIEELDLDEKTFVFFFSDNGDVRMSPKPRPYRGGKFSNYEGGHRVPAVARWPGKIEAGWVSSELTVGMDLLPTVMDIAGIEVPEDRKLDGISLKNHLLAKADVPDRPVFFGYEPKLGTAMRFKNWKMQTKRGVVELYDLSRDIKETTNVADRYPERAREMKAAIERWKLEVTPKGARDPAPASGRERAKGQSPSS